ncbi:MFS transporter [Thalassospira sp. MA62]|nr:MFS transporter [Thalassospira sp. MA62]
MNHSSYKPDHKDITKPHDLAREKSKVLVWLLIGSLGLLCLTLAVFSYRALTTFEERLVPEFQDKAELVARSISRDIERAVSVGIPIDQMVGVQDYLSNILGENDDISEITITPAGDVGGPDFSYHAGQATPDAPGIDHNIRHKGANVATVKIALNPAYISGQREEVTYEVLTTLLITMLVTYEMLAFLIYGRLLNPLQSVVNILKDGAVGRFSHSVHASATAELTRVENILNNVLYLMAVRARLFFDDANELRAAQIAPEKVNRIDQAVNTIRRKFEFSNPFEFREKDTNNIRALRLPLFLFMFAEELSRAFLPVYVKKLGLPARLQDVPDLAAGLPIMAFMAVLACVSLLSTPLAERFGSRRMFIIGLIPAVSGYVASYLFQDFYLFVASRMLSALGYGLIFVACQSYVAARSDPSSRATNMAIFVGAILVAGICGPAIGGILADRIGYAATFLVSAGLALLSGLLLRSTLNTDTDLHAGVNPQSDAKDAAQSTHEKRKASALPDFALLGNIRFASLAVLCAIPSKIMLTGIIFLLVPLYLSGMDAGDSAIGRVVMMYGIAVVVLMPQAAQMADRRHQHAFFVIVGGILAGLGGISLSVWDGVWAIVGVVALIGLGQALSISPQLALVQNIIVKSSTRATAAEGLSLFRFIERIGNVMGPLIAGSLATVYGAQMAVVIIGLIGLCSAVAFWIVAGPKLLREAISETGGE